MLQVMFISVLVIVAAVLLYVVFLRTMAHLVHGGTQWVQRRRRRLILSGHVALLTRVAFQQQMLAATEGWGSLPTHVQRYLLDCVAFELVIRTGYGWDSSSLSCLVSWLVDSEEMQDHITEIQVAVNRHRMDMQ